MDALPSVMRVWRRFAGVPCETFTKGWWFRRCGGRPRQRTVVQLRQHRRRYGAGGNCFDLAYWLLNDLREEGFAARIVSRDLLQYDAHVAVIVEASGREYLCDLGDMWHRPIRVAEHAGWLNGYVPGRSIRIRCSDGALEIDCRDEVDSVRVERYDMTRIDDELFLLACDQSQNLLRRPFCQLLRPHPVTGALELWGYDREATFVSGSRGHVYEPRCNNRAEWIARIAATTGMAPTLIDEGFTAYDEAAVAPPPQT